MRYERPELLAGIADEYVLGVLRDKARRRFDAILASHDAARGAVHRAEDRMLALSLALEPVQPSPETWEAITTRLGFASRADTQLRLPGPRWRVALAAAAAVLAIGVTWFVLQRAPQLTSVASVAAESGQQLWSVETFADHGRLSARATGLVERKPGNSYELWALPEGGAPVSLGLLPETGAVAREMTAAQRVALQRAPKIAVSLEPEGGSRTGAPTGPVLYVAELLVNPTRS